MPHPKPPFTGTCLCGAVQVRVTAPALLSIACHCDGCQKFSASAFSLTTMFPADAFTCHGTLDKGGLGSEGRDHFFCMSCKNFIYSQIGGAQERINLRTSVLDNAAAFPPFVELMTAHKLPWATTPARHSFAGFPETLEELQTLMVAYAAQ